MSIITKFNTALMEETQSALEAIDRVRELHRAVFWTSEDSAMCNQCTTPYPCATITAVDGDK